MKTKINHFQIISYIIIFAILTANFSFPPTVSAQKGSGNISIDRLPSKEKRFALIIGVDTYQQKDISPLYGSVNDAKALRDVLIKSAGFAGERIILMTSDSDDADLIPTYGNIIDQLDKLSRLVPEDGLLLFSFSGHGVSIGSDAFLVPSDGRIYQNADLMRKRSIDVLEIKRAIQATRVKQVIMFLDACRNDPVRAKGDADNNLTTAYAKGFSFETKNQNIEAYATLYATSFGDRAYEFLDKKTNKYRGYFNYAIEEGLKGSAANEKGEVTLAGLIRYIEDTVKERVRIFENQRQIPYPATEGFRNSDLIIAVAEKNVPTPTDANSGETNFWNTIENSNDIDDFENYLKRIELGEFKGIYKSAAEVKIAKFKKANSQKEIKNNAAPIKIERTECWCDNETGQNSLRIDVSTPNLSQENFSAKVFVNGKDVTSKITNQFGTILSLSGTLAELNLVEGKNQVVVSKDGIKSGPFYWERRTIKSSIEISNISCMCGQYATFTVPNKLLVFGSQWNGGSNLAVLVNGKDVSKHIESQTENTVVVVGSIKELNLIDGTNQVVVVLDGEKSNSYAFKQVIKPTIRQ